MQVVQAAYEYMNNFLLWQQLLIQADEPLAASCEGCIPGLENGKIIK